MLTKDGDLKEVQVQFNSLADWSNGYKECIGEYVIACSQWEYVYELLCKDLSIATGANLLERIIAADSVQLKSLRGKLGERVSCPPIIGPDLIS